MKNLIFPVVLITLNLCAALQCGVEGDIKMTLYWLLAATINCYVIL